MHLTVDHPPEEGRFWNKFVLWCQYLMAGVMMSMLFSIAYTYNHLPSYNVVALFSLIGIIPNFRFLLAPLIENHTSLTYGKRKTWMVISTFFKSLVVFIMSFYTREDQQIQLAAIFALAKTFLGISKTTMDALALKQYKEKGRMSFLQTAIHRIGTIIGSLCFLKLISPTFYVHFGRTQPFLTVPEFFYIISGALFILGVLSHFLYKQDEWDTEEIIMHKNYCQLVKQYKVFFDIDNTYCRLIIFYFIHHLGLACFISGFRYAIIQDYGVSRETFVTITSLMFLTAIPFSYCLSRHIAQDTIAWKLQTTIMIRLVCDIIAFTFKLSDTLHLCIYFFFSDNTREFESIILRTVLNQISTVGLAGMFLSAASGLRLVVQNHSWSLKLIDIFGYQLCCTVGFVQQFIILFYIPKLVQWVFDGKKPEEVKQTHPQLVEQQR